MGAGSSTAPGYDSDTEFGQIDPEISFDDTAPLDPPPQPLTQNQENELDKLCQEISSQLSTIAKKVSHYLHFFAISHCRTLSDEFQSLRGELASLSAALDKVKSPGQLSVFIRGKTLLMYVYSP